MKNKVVILDRDGVLNEDLGYVYKIEDLEIIEGVIPALQKIQKAGYKLIIITNQSGVGRGYYSLAEMEEFNNLLISELNKEGIKIEKFFYCPHQPDDKCQCRKPKELLGNNAIKDFDIDVSQSYGIGDKDSDTQFAKNLGIKSILLDRDQYQVDIKPDYRVENWEEISNIIK